jgi:hypothetical protein
MQTQQPSHSRIRRAVNDLVLAEMFLVQATIESAAAIGDGFNALGERIALRDDPAASAPESISDTLAHIADGAIEPYATRFRFFRQMRQRDD